MSGRRHQEARCRLLGGRGDTIPIAGSTRQARRAKAVEERRAKRRRTTDAKPTDG